MQLMRHQLVVAITVLLKEEGDYHHITLYLAHALGEAQDFLIVIQIGTVALQQIVQAETELDLGTQLEK